VDRQAIVGNREILCVVVPGGDVQPPGGLHCHFA